MTSSARRDDLLKEIGIQATLYGVPASIMAALADHESGLNPDVGVTTIQPDPAHPTNTAAGAFQMTKPTAESVGASYDAILGGSVYEQTWSACELYRRNRASTGTDDGAIGAHYVGAAGYKRIMQGETLFGVTRAALLSYIEDIRRRSSKFSAIA